MILCSKRQINKHNFFLNLICMCRLTLNAYCRKCQMHMLTTISKRNTSLFNYLIKKVIHDVTFSAYFANIFIWHFIQKVLGVLKYLMYIYYKLYRYIYIYLWLFIYMHLICYNICIYIYIYVYVYTYIYVYNVYSMYRYMKTNHKRCCIFGKVVNINIFLKKRKTT